MQLIDIANASTKAVETATTVTAEHAAGTTEATEGLLASLGINGTLFLFQLINFAIVVAILWFLVLKPLTKKMGERQEKIEDSLKNAEAVEENLRKSESKYQEKIQNVENTINLHEIA